MRTQLPSALTEQIENAGYYPALVADAVGLALGGEQVAAHLVQGEATFDGEDVRRHLSVMVLTPTRLIFVHADDDVEDEASGVSRSMAFATSEAVPLSAVRSVVLSMGVANPESYRRGEFGGELTMTISWGAVQRIDLEPVECGDPNCMGDHGFTGTQTGDDLVIRVSSAAEGASALAQAVEFARALSAATAPRR